MPHVTTIAFDMRGTRSASIARWMPSWPDGQPLGDALASTRIVTMSVS